MEYGLYIKSDKMWLLVAGPFLKHEQKELQKLLKLYQETFTDDEYKIAEYSE